MSEAAAPKLSRYRTLRGRNVPESRRYVEPNAAEATGKSARDAGDGPGDGPGGGNRQSFLPPSVPLPCARNSVITPDALAMLEEQKRKDLERLQQQLANHQTQRPAKTTREKLSSLFIRRRGRLATDAELKVDPRASRVVSSSAPDNGTTVLVNCHQFSSYLPFQPETTVADLLQACSKFSAWNIHPDVCTLVESYTSLGLERRLRRYERIRDILNSWDYDHNNCLIIVPLAADGRGADLELAAVTCHRTTPPPGASLVQVYHSQKPGRWNKCFVSLIETTGQIVTSKKPDAAHLASLIVGESTSAKRDIHSLCRLSDYDVYKPTVTEMRKHLKPPKKLCFAVKSQQRTTVFVNTENYVNFFCTDDSLQGRMLYDRIFAWRSWYIARRHLGLPHPNSPTSTDDADSYKAKPPATAPERHAALSIPQNEISRDGPFTSGSLLDPANSPRPSTAAVPSRSEPPSQQPSTSECPPRSSAGRPARTLTVSSRPTTARPTSARPTSSRQMADHEGDGITRRRSLHQIGAPSQRHPPLPTPLVDLTPSFREAPQWSTERRGHGVRAPPGTTHLVELATRHVKDEVSSALEAPIRRDDPGLAPPSNLRPVRAQTMTSASASNAASFARVHHTVHHAQRGDAAPPVPLLSRIPPKTASSYDGR